MNKVAGVLETINAKAGGETALLIAADGRILAASTSIDATLTAIATYAANYVTVSERTGKNIQRGIMQALVLVYHGKAIVLAPLGLSAVALVVGSGTADLGNLRLQLWRGIGDLVRAVGEEMPELQLEVRAPISEPHSSPTKPPTAFLPDGQKAGPGPAPSPVATHPQGIDPYWDVKDGSKVPGMPTRQIPNRGAPFTGGDNRSVVFPTEEPVLAEMKATTSAAAPSKVDVSAPPRAEPAVSPTTATRLSSNVDEPVVVIRPSRGLFSIRIRELWEYRELLYFLIWRDIKVRYSQTVLGAAWAILQPVLTMVVFTVFFGNFAKIPSDGIPYPIFAYAALLPWNLFANALSNTTDSLVGNRDLISKVYFPRLIIPLAATLSGIVDFSIAFVIMLGMMVWFGIAPTAGVVALPLFLLLALLTALGMGLWLSSLNVKYRDVRYVIPFMIQIWMFISPVVYSVSVVPEKWRLLYSLNPVAGTIEGFRWALLGKASPHLGVIIMSAAGVVLVLLSGLVFFKHMERSFADLI